MSNLTLSPHYLEVGVNLLWNSAVNMDDFVAMLQAKLGPMTFGAILGFVLQVLIFRPKNWVLAAERAGAAIVTLTNPRFENSAGVEDAGFVTMDMAMKFNGLTDELGDKTTFDRNASSAEKQAAVRNRLNAILRTYEIGVTLNNANIQIVGMPV